MNYNTTNPYSFFGFPTINDFNSRFSYKIFFSSNQYEIPAQHTFLSILLISGGNGGGSGRLSNTTTAAFGGNGGSAGSIIFRTFLIKDLLKYGNLLDIEIGAGGDGGAEITTNDTNGNPGLRGGSSRIKFSGSPIYFINAKSYPVQNNIGVGGTTSSSSVSATSIPLTINPSWNGIIEGKLNHFIEIAMEGIASFDNGFVGQGSSSFNAQPTRPSHGYGGAVKTATNLFRGSSNCFNSVSNLFYDTYNWRYVYSSNSGVTVPGISQTIAPNTQEIRSIMHLNWWGGRGGSHVAGLGIAGLNGLYGSGGGGGAGNVNGSTSGAGGRGGDGVCIIISRG